MRKMLMFLAVLCLMAASVQASTWTGSGGTLDWFDPANWNSGVPTAATEARIDNGDFVVISPYYNDPNTYDPNDIGQPIIETAEASNVTLGQGTGDGGLVIMPGAELLANTGQFVVAYDTVTEGTLEVWGKLVANNGLFAGRKGIATVNIMPGADVIVGNVEMQAGDTIMNMEGGVFECTGTQMKIPRNGGTATIYITGGTFIGREIRVSHGTGDFGSIIQDGGAVELNQLTLGGAADVADANYLLAGGTLTVDTSMRSYYPTAAFYFDGGTLSATTWDSNMGDMANNGGTVNPGKTDDTTVQMTVNGNYTSAATSKIAVDLGGHVAGTDYDVLNITGNAAIDGELVVAFVDGFELSVTDLDTFTVLTAASITGTFTNVDGSGRVVTSQGEGSFLVTYGSGDVQLSDFIQLSNMAPAVEAGANKYVWLTGGIVDVDMFDATVTDGILPVGQPVTQLWTVDSTDPPGLAAVGFAVDTDINPIATFTETGSYVLKLTADDTDLTDFDTVTVNVFDTECNAIKAAAAPGNILFDADVNADCFVDLIDLAIMAANWQRCNDIDPAGCL